jgi:hypothetical protein
VDRAALEAELARLNHELLLRGGAPSFDSEVAGELFSLDELRRAVHFTAQDVLARREER